MPYDVGASRAVAISMQAGNGTFIIKTVSVSPNRLDIIFKWLFFWQGNMEKEIFVAELYSTIPEMIKFIEYNVDTSQITQTLEPERYSFTVS